MHTASPVRGSAATGAAAMAGSGADGRLARLLAPAAPPGARPGHVVKQQKGHVSDALRARSGGYAAAAPAPLPPAPAPVAAEAARVLSPAASVCTFTVNGEQYTIDAAKDTRVTGMTTVHDWLAAHVPATGLRRNCGMGKCGVCVSTLSYTDPATGRVTHRAFNTCLRPILSCNGMAITTVRGIGSTDQPHAVQAALAENGGSQCGYCSAGQVMSIYAQLTDGAGARVTKEQLERCLDGNLCRCTGYRPIVDTAKSFAADYDAAPPPHPLLAADDTLRQRAAAARAAAAPAPPAPAVALPPAVSAGSWVEARTEAELQKALRGAASAADVMLVGGRTTQGLYGDRAPDAFISVAGIASLRGLAASADALTIGAAVTMTDAQAFLSHHAASVPALRAVADHALLSPSTPIRNAGTVGGNVMMMHEHQNDGLSFATEWPLLLQGLGATATVVDSSGAAAAVPLDAFWATAMKGKYIRSFSVPLKEQAGRVMRTYRTSGRHHYAQAYAAAAMSCAVEGGRVVAGSARVVLTNIAARPLRAAALERALDGAAVADEANFHAALLPALEKDLSAAADGLYGDKGYRVRLARGYFYKFLLALQPSLAPRLRSAAAAWIPRAPSTATQAFQTDESVYPLNEPIPKLDGLKQACGESQYVQDVAVPTGTLHAAPVLATAVGKISEIDTSAAEAVPGWSRLLSNKEVGLLCPGILVGMDLSLSSFIPVFAKGETEYIGQVVALALADSQDAAVACAKAVSVTYSGAKSPLVLTCDDAVAAGSYIKQNAKTLTQGDAAKGLAGADHVAKDTFRIQEQYHFAMETQSCLAVPNENGLLLHSATQLPKVTHLACQLMLIEKASKIELRQRRLGGGFGSKLFASSQMACIAAFAAKHTKRPVRLLMEMSDCMVAIGRRVPFRADTQVGFNADGTITTVQADCYFGNSGGDTGAFLKSMDNCYNIANWSLNANEMKLDLPITQSCRAPGWLPGIWFAERVIGLVASKLGMPTAAVREKNFYSLGQVTPYGMPLKGWTISELWQQVKDSSKYQSRAAAVAAFNKANRWVKKGLALVPSKFTVSYYGALTNIMMDGIVSINADGSVSVMSGGTEMGQGLTTKVAQTVAYHLGCEVSDIEIQEQSTATLGSLFAGVDLTGGSIGSEWACLAAKDCCDELNKRLAPVRKLLGPKATFAEVAAKAAELGVDTHSKKMNTGSGKGVKGDLSDVYNTYGVVCMECTLDVLTGQVDIGRCDLAFDIGRTVNPDIDIGQIEGGFVMGLGLAMIEDINYYPNGQMTWWQYEALGAQDIPSEWNISLFNAKPNPVTAGGGKAVGEPPITLSYAVVDAVEQALAAAAADAGTAPALAPSLPFTVDRRQAAAGADAAQFTLS